MDLILLGIFAYLLGSIPSAVIVGKVFYNIDVRDYGSGNAGATNTFRVLGVWPGIAVLILDMAKGSFAAGLVFLQTHYLPGQGYQWVNLKLIFGGLAVLGHLYPVFASFRGGKGIATLLGVVIAIHYLSALACAGIFIAILLGTRYVSLSSIMAAIAFPLLLALVFQKDNPYFIAFAITTAFLVIATHQKNIKRLLTRTESKANILPKHRTKK